MQTFRGRRSAPVLEHDVAQRTRFLDRLPQLPTPWTRRGRNETLPDQSVDLALPDRHDSRDRPPAIGDDDLFAVADTLDEAAEVGAELSDANFHGRADCSDIFA